MRKLILLISLMGLASQTFSQGEWGPSESDKTQAVQVLQAFLTALRDSRLEDAYEMLTPGMHALTPFDQWRQLEDEFKRRSGGSARFGNTRATWYKDPAGAELPGVYVAFDLDCRYEKIDLCHEVFM